MFVTVATLIGETLALRTVCRLLLLLLEELGFLALDETVSELTAVNEAMVVMIFGVGVTGAEVLFIVVAPLALLELTLVVPLIDDPLLILVAIVTPVKPFCAFFMCEFFK